MTKKPYEKQLHGAKHPLVVPEPQTPVNHSMRGGHGQYIALETDANVFCLRQEKHIPWQDEVKTSWVSSHHIVLYNITHLPCPQTAKLSLFTSKYDGKRKETALHFLASTTEVRRIITSLSHLPCQEETNYTSTIFAGVTSHHLLLYFSIFSFFHASIRSLSSSLGLSISSDSGCRENGSVEELRRCRTITERSMFTPLGRVTGSNMRVSMRGSLNSSGASL